MIVAFASGPSLAADVPSAAADVEIKACYQNSIRKCCDVAPNVDLTIECESGDDSWICVGKVISNTLVDVAVRSKEGKKKKRSLGTGACTYVKPACGSWVGSCTMANDQTVATCKKSTAYGANCVSPTFMAAFEDEDEGALQNLECHPDLLRRY